MVVCRRNCNRIIKEKKRCYIFKNFVKFQLIILIFFSSFFSSAQNVVDYVNPFIGTSNFGATNPGAIAPRGMVSVSPFNVADKKDKGWLSNPVCFRE